MSATSKVPIRETSASERNDYGSNSSQLAEPVRTQQSVLPYLRLFWEHRRFLLRAGSYAFAASILLAFLIPTQYRSVTRLMPPDNQPSSGLGLLAMMSGRNPGLGALAGDFLGVKSSGALFVGILGSETVQDRLINEFHLMKVYHISKIEDARKALAERTDISEDRKSGIITIDVTDHVPERAAAMARAYVAELDRLVAQVSTSSARRERIFLEGRLEKVKGDLDTAAKNFSQFASKNSAIDIPAQGKAMVEAAATLQGQLIVAQAELSGLQQIYTDNNVRVRSVEARVNELQKKLNEVGSAGTPGGSQTENSLYPSIRKLPLLGVTYADLYRETKIQETVYELLTQQYELAKVQEAKEIPTVRVLDAAIVPTKKSFPPRTVIVVLGMILGFTLAMTWILGKVYWGAVDANDARRVFATEVFATLQARMPKVPGNGTDRGANGSRWKWRKEPFAADDKGEDESHSI